RHRAIVDRIAKQNADIVVLQEVWAKGRMERVRKELSSRYPFSAQGADGDYIFEYLPKLIISGIPERAAGSGVVLLSKFPIGDVRFELYQRPHDDEEKAASKGVLTAVVQIDGYPLRIGMTHMWTDAGHDCSNVSDLVGWSRVGNFPSTLMIGDF